MVFSSRNCALGTSCTLQKGRSLFIRILMTHRPTSLILLTTGCSAYYWFRQNVFLAGAFSVRCRKVQPNLISGTVFTLNRIRWKKGPRKVNATGVATSISISKSYADLHSAFCGHALLPWPASVTGTAWTTLHMVPARASHSEERSNRCRKPISGDGLLECNAETAALLLLSNCLFWIV